MTTPTSTKNPMARVMSLRDFRLLFGGTTTSLLGDQFALIATPWLVLKLTGDPLALGIVLALEGIPRAISGAVSKWSLTALFASAGVLILLVKMWAALRPGLKTFSESLTASAATGD